MGSDSEKSEIPKDESVQSRAVDHSPMIISLFPLQIELLLRLLSLYITIDTFHLHAYSSQCLLAKADKRLNWKGNQCCSIKGLVLRVILVIYSSLCGLFEHFH